VAPSSSSILGVLEEADPPFSAAAHVTLMDMGV
jgi:hypothetical protein